MVDFSHVLEKETSMKAFAPTSIRRELAHRTTNGIEVTLLWSAEEDALAVQVIDTAGEQAFEVVVERDQAMHAFHHPYAYAALETTRAAWAA
jgi:hypothetical protein